MIVEATNDPAARRTFWFSDIEGSTRLWEHFPDAMPGALARHDALLRQVIEAHGGGVFKTVGDAFCAVFDAAAAAARAALAAQRAVRAETWPGIDPLRIRVALHTGPAEARAGDFFGASVNRVARLLAAGHGGQTLLSLATRELLNEEVALRDMGSHRLKDLIQPERIFQLLADDLPAEFPPLRTLDMRPNNLPAQPTALVGRETEVAAARDLLLRSEVRLLTLTGPGGTGKTRLALQAAAEVSDEFPDGVFFVDLTPITDPELVAAAIVQALGILLGDDLAAEAALAAHLGERKLLLLLDNFEQVTGAAPLVARLLAGSPGVKALVTSRAPLRLRAEHALNVPPLAPNAAVELFVQRARAVQPDFALTDETAPAVLEICERLDGLPLALELAAARITLLPPAALRARLESRLDLLTDGAQDLPVHQRTLRATLSWSYDLLTPIEQALFRRLTVFVGGCTLLAAEAVCNDCGDLGVSVLGGMASLVDKSLLRQVAAESADPEPRFRMLETTREYGAEELAARGEDASLRRDHARFFTALAAEIEPRFVGGERGLWLTRLEAERDNLRAALAWADAHGDAEMRVRLSVAAALSEGGGWLERALALTGALGLATVGDKMLPGAEALTRLPGDLSVARSRFAGGMARMGRRIGRAVPPGLAARVAALQSEVGTLGDRLRETTGDTRSSVVVASSLRLLGSLAQHRGDHRRAEALFQESLTLYRRQRKWRCVAVCLSELAESARLRGNPERAALLLGAAETIFDAHGVFRDPEARRDHERNLAALGNLLDETALSRGRALPLEEAIAAALMEDEKGNDAS